MNTDTQDFAWACGLFEGEGCIEYSLKPTKCCLKPQRRRRLTIGMTDRWVLERFRDIVGVGTIYGPYPRGTNQPMYTWITGRWADIEPLLTAMRPWLSPRRQELADRLLANPALPAVGRPRQT